MVGGWWSRLPSVTRRRFRTAALSVAVAVALSQMSIGCTCASSCILHATGEFSVKSLQPRHEAFAFRANRLDQAIGAVNRNHDRGVLAGIIGNIPGCRCRSHGCSCRHTNSCWAGTQYKSSQFGQVEKTQLGRPKHSYRHQAHPGIFMTSTVARPSITFRTIQWSAAS